MKEIKAYVRPGYLDAIIEHLEAQGARDITVIRTDEEQMIARSVCRALGLGMAREERDSDHATNYIYRLDPYLAGGVPP